MKSLSILALFAVLTLAPANAKPLTQYQVTGPILELTDTTIVVQKGKEKWELARDASTVVKGDLKVGSKVTIQYTMTAASVEVKADKPAPAAK